MGLCFLSAGDGAGFLWVLFRLSFASESTRVPEDAGRLGNVGLRAVDELEVGELEVGELEVGELEVGGLTASVSDWSSSWGIWVLTLEGWLIPDLKTAGCLGEWLRFEDL